MVTSESRRVTTPEIRTQRSERRPLRRKGIVYVYDQSITSGGIMTADTPGPRRAATRARPSPKELFDELGEAAYELAKAAALKAKARDHHVFMCDWAANPKNTDAITSAQARVQAQAQQRTRAAPQSSDKVRCDGCRRPHWINGMAEFGGEALCPGCMGEPMTAGEVRIWEVIVRGVEQQGAVHFLSPGPPEPTASARAVAAFWEAQEQ